MADSSTAVVAVPEPLHALLLAVVDNLRTLHAEHHVYMDLGTEVLHSVERCVSDLAQEEDDTEYAVGFLSGEGAHCQLHSIDSHQVPSAACPLRNSPSSFVHQTLNS